MKRITITTEFDCEVPEGTDLKNLVIALNLGPGDARVFACRGWSSLPGSKVINYKTINVTEVKEETKTPSGPDRCPSDLHYAYINCECKEDDRL
jgi:hypothetical protein